MGALNVTFFLRNVTTLAGNPQKTWKASRLFVTTLAALVTVSACTTTPKGSFCQVAEPIRPANVDVLTDAEVTAILQHNAKGERLCRWKP